MDEKRRARWLLAERLREQAEHSSEIEMRMSISRMYYAVFHAAAVITGVTDHKNMPGALDGIEQGLGQPYKQLLDLRNQADYAPAFETLGIADLQSLRDEMDKARALYERLKQLNGE